MFMRSINTIICFLLLLLTTFCGIGCRNKSNSISKYPCKIECRLYWVADNYYEDSLMQANQKHPHMRQISLNYLLINHTSSNMFVPMKTWIDTTICSQISAFIKNKQLNIRIHKRTSFYNYVIAANDTTMIKIVIKGSDLKKAGISERTNLKRIVSNLSLFYLPCSCDNKKSKYQLCSDILFSKNDTILYYYRPKDSYDVY